MADLVKIEKLNNASSDPVCCFETDADNDFNVMDMMTGWARIIKYDTKLGVSHIGEGQFVGGYQNSFGRFMTIGSEEFEYSFVGWYPTEDLKGKGIGTVNRKNFYQGVYARATKFPETYKVLADVSPSITNINLM